MSKYIHRAIALFVLVLSFIAFWNTTQPSIAFWDCGELTAASFGLMVTHPPGALDLPLRVYELSLAMAIFSTVLPVFLLSWAIRHIGSGSASMIGVIGPVSTIYLAHVFLHESISLLQIAGSALVLGGVVMISLGKMKGSP